MKRSQCSRMPFLTNILTKEIWLKILYIKSLLICCCSKKWRRRSLVWLLKWIIGLTSWIFWFAFASKWLSSAFYSWYKFVFMSTFLFNKFAIWGRHHWCKIWLSLFAVLYIRIWRYFTCSVWVRWFYCYLSICTKTGDF